MNNIDNFITGLKQYLYNTGIQRKDGGVNIAYDWKEKTHPFIYHEITGYGVSVGVNCYEWYGDESYLNLAKLSAKYLIDVKELDRKSIFHGVWNSTNKKSGRYYTFDNAIILQGLCALYKYWQDEALYDLIDSISDWLVCDMQTKEGKFYAYVDEEGAKDHYLETFEGDFGCLHAKHSVGLFRAAEITNKREYFDAAVKVSNWVLELQEKGSGLFWTNEFKNNVFTHSHCYTLEGLLYTFWETKDNKYLESVQRGAEALKNLQRIDGSIPHTPVDNRGLKPRIRSFLAKGVTTDATTQAAKLWMALDRMEDNADYSKQINKALAWVESQQALLGDGDKNRSGGLYYHVRDLPFLDKKHPHMNTWCSQFALCALETWKGMGHDDSKITLDLDGIKKQWL